MKLIHTLKQPYTYYYNQKDLPLETLIVFTFFFFFTYLFEPFNVNSSEHVFNFFFICSIHGLVAAFLFFIYFSINNLRPEEEKWNLGKEITHLIFLLLLVGFGNYLIRPIIYNNPDNISIFYLWEEILHTWLVGILLILFIIPLNFIRLYKSNSKKAAKLGASPFEHTITSKTFRIHTQTQIDTFDLNVEKLMFAKAEGNYVEFVLEGEDLQLTKEVKRISLKELEDQLKNCSWIVKTHRSYLLNLNKIEKISGNAQGYSILLNNTDIQIPVSRSNLKKFNVVYNQFKYQ
ncbi:LytTR family transcriptional regulator [Christiangramia fulva]|uniref:LytTR family transcriptional regulator n=1 Tax=Christiangramia fulva TaxID=2126553 RepID=A0A2R3Z2X0_9FLAO|nr:LytTR family DNA-binding domain-containing protein [Christiangramia fulva]AVR44589.1 LytTR family transcriptional regulator [Christiangramia fulva]